MASAAPEVFNRCIERGEIAIGWLEDEDPAGRDREGIAELVEAEYGNERAINSINSINSLVNEIRDEDYVAVLKNQRQIRATGIVNSEYRYRGADYGRRLLTPIRVRL